MLTFETKPIIGMVHLPPLPGSPRATLRLADVIERAVADAEQLVAGGVDALMIENFGDVPFFPGRVPAITVAAMTRAARAVKERCSVPLGINVLRNDGLSALSVAVAVEANFVRVNVLCGARVTDQGVVAGIAHDLLRLRQQLDARQIQILADVDVKHSAPLAVRPIADEVADTLQRGCADALIISGAGTGLPLQPSHLEAAKESAGDAPVLAGSGVSAESIATLAPLADGFIVGSALKVDGEPTNPVERSRVESLVKTLRDNA